MNATKQRRSRAKHVPKFRTHRKAHETVLKNEAWYGDGKPHLTKQFSARQTARRQKLIVAILQRAARRAARARKTQLKEDFRQLSRKLKHCGPNRRCGSLACPECARAFQKAKAAAQGKAIKRFGKPRKNKQLVWVTLIPGGLTYPPGEFFKINGQNANRLLKDTLKRAGINRVVMGSVDLEWDHRKKDLDGNYLQLHWHLACWTSNPELLRAKLQSVFPRSQPYERPVDVKVPPSLGFLPYANKLLKLPALLRAARRQLPELSLALDAIGPLDLLILMKVRLSTNSGGLRFREIKPKTGRTPAKRSAPCGMRCSR